MTSPITRRRFLETGGAIVVAFAWTDPVRGLARAANGGPLTPGAAGLAPEPDALPPDQVDSWIRIDDTGAVTLHVGKVELGTGVETALAQVLAEELDYPVRSIKVVMGSTGQVPDQGSTTGSKTLQTASLVIRQAAATAKRKLIELAAQRLSTPIEHLTTHDGVVSIKSGGLASVSYAALVPTRQFNLTVDPKVPLKHPSDFRVIGQPVHRLDLPPIILGTYEYVHNVRIPGMVHGRVVRPAMLGATLSAVDESSVSALPGNVRVVRRENFLGVVADREDQAIHAAQALRVTWQPPAQPLPTPEAMYDAMVKGNVQPKVLVSTGNADAAMSGGHRKLSASYRHPYQSHASIGPSCGVADVRNGKATIWSGTQGAYSLRDTIADLLGMPASAVSVNWVEASGCYGHNGADDAAADAAVLSQAVGKPVRVQWSRQDETGWDPKGPAMVMDVRGALDDHGNVVGWDYTVTTPPHSTRPNGQASHLLAGQLMGHPLELAGEIGGDRNAKHAYAFPANRVSVRWLTESVLRPSAMRGLGAPANVFAIESFMDELAAAAGVDPLEFRLRYLKDPRAVAVLRKAAELGRWQPRKDKRPAKGQAPADVVTGQGLAFMQYESEFTYVSTVVTADVNRSTGGVRVTHAAVAHDCGLVVNPDGLRNQIEGGTIQSISRALLEQVTWDQTHVTSLDWATYPILTFADVPDTVDVALLDHPDAPPWGAGEPAACTVAAAIGNAIYDAIGVRLREVPFTSARVKQAIAVAART